MVTFLELPLASEFPYMLYAISGLCNVNVAVEILFPDQVIISAVANEAA